MTKSSTQTRTEAGESQRTDKQIGSPTRIHRVSPWPPFVALGFATAEIGIILNVVPLAIGGIILFGGSVAGILAETRYVKSPWRPLVVLGGIFVVGGSYLYASQVPQFALERLLSGDAVNAIAMRGEAILIAGVLLIAGSVLGTLLKPRNTDLT